MSADLCVHGLLECLECGSARERRLLRAVAIMLARTVVWRDATAKEKREHADAFETDCAEYAEVLVWAGLASLRGGK